MIPPHLFYQIYPSFVEQNDCLHQDVANCQNTLTVLTEVEDISSRYMNGSSVYDRCGHDTTRLYPSCTGCRRTANLRRFVLHLVHLKTDRTDAPYQRLFMKIRDKYRDYIPIFLLKNVYIVLSY